jgi:hypothetical protein
VESKTGGLLKHDIEQLLPFFYLYGKKEDIDEIFQPLAKIPIILETKNEDLFTAELSLLKISMASLESKTIHSIINSRTDIDENMKNRLRSKANEVFNNISTSSGSRRRG